MELIFFQPLSRGAGLCREGVGVCLFKNRNHGNGLIFKEIGTKKYQYKKPNDNGIKYYYKDVVQIFSQLIESEIPPRILEPEK